MSDQPPQIAQSSACIAFTGHRLLARGPMLTVSRIVARARANEPDAAILAFDVVTGRQIELDLRPEATAPSSPHQDVELAAADASPDAEAHYPAPPRGRGRPKLGVEAREVTLLPRHWEWLASQPGGASAALRRLVEEARKGAVTADLARARRDATYGFIHAMAGDFAGFEAAARALFADDADSFAAILRQWPPDVAAFARELSGLKQTGEDAVASAP